MKKKIDRRRLIYKDPRCGRDFTVEPRIGEAVEKDYRQDH